MRITEYLSAEWTDLASTGWYTAEVWTDTSGVRMARMERI
jgi:hypothetical protein